LQERGHCRLHTGVTSWHNNLALGELTGLGWGVDLVVDDDLANLREVVVGEDDGQVQLETVAYLLELRVLRLKVADDAAHLGVLSAVDDGLATEGNANLVQLVGADVVDIHQEQLGVVGEVLFELFSELVLTILLLL